MSSSLSALERGNPPPRRKSCVSCVKAKRRCDASRPRCRRCCQRGIKCVYSAGSVSMSARSVFSADTPDALSCPPIPHLIMPVMEVPPTDPLWVDTAIGLDASFPRWVEDESSTTTIECPASSIVVDTTLASDVADFFHSGINAIDRILEEVAAESALARRNVSALFAPQSKDFGAVAQVVTARLQYALDRIADSPRQMVHDNQTPWCHPSLYSIEMPRTIQDALACCALYVCKNQTNASVILRTIEAKVRNIIEAPKPTTPLGHLAQAQALLLCHIIRCLDGDIQARSAAEMTISALESAATSLLPHITFEDEAEDVSIQALPIFPVAHEVWRTWLFQESARRTFLMIFFFIQLYRLLSGHQPMVCDGKLYLCHSWTLSAHLWGAHDAVDFAVAWRDRKHFVVTNANIMRVITDAKGDDVETFGKILLTSLMGVEETRCWLAARGASL